MNKPLILDFARKLKKDNHPGFYFDNEINLNVIKIEGKVIPFVEVNKFTYETMTKTYIKREDEDDSLLNLELYTKTKQERESDDDMLECLTKTAKAREKDDEDFMELMTKTERKPEEDEDDFLYYQ